jgi:hypothetical protein
LCWCRAISAHVFLERAFVAEGVVSGRGLLFEEAVEASGWAVTWYRWVGAATVPRVVVFLEVPTLAADPTVFVHHRVSGAGVYIVG